MTTVVLTTLKEDKLDKNILKCNFVVDDKKTKRKKSLLTDSLEKLDLKSARRLNGNKEDIHSCESDYKCQEKKLEKNNNDKKIYKLTDGINEEKVDLISKYNLDFKYSCMSFPIIFSKRYEKDTRLQLNMDYDIYSFLNDIVHNLGKKSKKIKLSKLRQILINDLDHMIKSWSDKTKEKYFYQKAEGLVDEYIRFKKELLFHYSFKK
tara:strand:+ start:212 stop:832 length:621 start_codon:yes stop_codon:yes gene_type:complete